jgi:SAM-dependent methyltransferase
MPPCWACGTAAAATDEYGSVGMHRCPACGMRFLAHVTPVNTRGLYDAGYFQKYEGGDYEASEPQRRREARLRLKWMRAWTGPPARLLEIGSAAGYFLDEARRDGFDPVGVEPAASVAEKAAARFDIRVHTAFLSDVELPEQAFDVVCAWHVIEHIPDPLPALNVIRAAAKRDAHLFVEVPNADGAIARRQGSSWQPLGLPHHVGQYGPTSISALFERAGFEVVSVDTVPFWLYARPHIPASLWRIARAAVVSVRAGAVLRGPHPIAHDLLRVVARPAP